MIIIASIILAMVIGSLSSAFGFNTTSQSIMGPNASIIIDAINAKLKKIYDDDDQKSTDSLTTTITKIKH